MRMFFLLLVFATTSVLYAESSENITINGYFSFEVEDRVHGDEHKRADEHQSFDSDMIDIVLNVKATDRLRIAVDFTWEHGSQTEVDKGNVGYEYAFAEYTISDSIKIRSGKMFTPFGIYNELHTAKPSTIIVKEPNPTNKMYFISSDTYEQNLLYPRWGTGIAILGNSEILNTPFDYTVQVTNGDLSYGVDENEYDKDDNDHKAVTARVRADITNDLQIGASVYHDVMNRYTNGDVNGTMEVSSQGLQMIWHLSDNLRFEAEYMTGTLDVKGVKSFRRSGYSMLPSYYITENINLFLLYAKADPSHNIKNNSVTNIAPGINIEIDKNMYLKIDLYSVISEKDNVMYNGKKYTEARAALAIGF